MKIQPILLEWRDNLYLKYYNLYNNDYFKQENDYNLYKINKYGLMLCYQNFNKHFNSGYNIISILQRMMMHFFDSIGDKISETVKIRAKDLLPGSC